MSSIDPAAGWIAAASLAVVFMVSAGLKLGDPSRFRSAVAGYHLLPGWLEVPISWVVPLTEVAGALGILLYSTRFYAAFGLLLLLALFTVAIGVNLIRGRRDVDCGCFGPALRQTLSGWLVWRNGALMMLAIVAASPAGSRALESIDLVTIGCGTMTLVTLYAAMNFLLANAPRLAALSSDG